MLNTKNVYIPADESDGQRILADRLCPQGVNCDGEKIVKWLPNVAPGEGRVSGIPMISRSGLSSNSGIPRNCPHKENLVRRIAERSASGRVTIVYSSKDEEHNHAIALKQLVEERSHS